MSICELQDLPVKWRILTKSIDVRCLYLMFPDWQYLWDSHL